jgi:hypothetical protein
MLARLFLSVVLASSYAANVGAFLPVTSSSGLFLRPGNSISGISAAAPVSRSARFAVKCEHLSNAHPSVRQLNSLDNFHVLKASSRLSVVALAASHCRKVTALPPCTPMRSIPRLVGYCIMQYAAWTSRKCITIAFGLAERACATLHFCRLKHLLPVYRQPLY